jgi:hypothetical protein
MSNTKRGERVALGQELADQILETANITLKRLVESSGIVFIKGSDSSAEHEPKR